MSVWVAFVLECFVWQFPKNKTLCFYSAPQSFLFFNQVGELRSGAVNVRRTIAGNGREVRGAYDKRLLLVMRTVALKCCHQTKRRQSRLILENCTHPVVRKLSSYLKNNKPSIRVQYEIDFYPIICSNYIYRKITKRPQSLTSMIN